MNDMKGLSMVEMLDQIASEVLVGFERMLELKVDYKIGGTDRFFFLSWWLINPLPFTDADNEKKRQEELADFRNEYLPFLSERQVARMAEAVKEDNRFNYSALRVISKYYPNSQEARIFQGTEIVKALSAEVE